MSGNQHKHLLQKFGSIPPSPKQTSSLPAFDVVVASKTSSTSPLQLVRRMASVGSTASTLHMIATFLEVAVRCAGREPRRGWCLEKISVSFWNVTWSEVSRSRRGDWFHTLSGITNVGPFHPLIPFNNQAGIPPLVSFCGFSPTLWYCEYTWLRENAKSIVIERGRRLTTLKFEIEGRVGVGPAEGQRIAL